MNPLPSIKRLLRMPKVIVGELSALTLLCALGAAVPQVGSATSAELESLRQGGAIKLALMEWFGLDRIFSSALFVAACALVSASLLVVVFDQLKRFAAQWKQKLTAAHFRSAPFHAEFEVDRSAALPDEISSGLSPGSSVRIWSQSRIGLLGSPILHVGLLLIIAAGALKALFGTSATVDLVEGETLSASASAWPAQYCGLLGKPFQLDAPLTLKAVKPARYQDGSLRDLKAELLLAGDREPTLAEMAVNHDLRIRGKRLFLGSEFGPAAFVEWQQGEGKSKRDAAMLIKHGQNGFESSLVGMNGETAYFRAQIGRDGARPQALEVRVMKGGTLLFTGIVSAGRTVALPNGGRLVLHGLPFWARVRGNGDYGMWLIYVGFAFVLVGALLVVAVVKQDFCVIVTPMGERKRVFVALKPQRFAPLFQEKFEQLVRQLQESGGGEENLSAGGVLDISPAIAGRQPPGPVPTAFAPAGASPCPLGNARMRNPSPLSGRAVYGIESGGWRPAIAGLISSTPPAASVSTVPATSTRQAALVVALVACLVSGCGQSGTSQARKLVERYNQVVSEAYRRGDIRLVDPVVGPNEGKKLTGLIGVLLDEGMTLDSQLTALEIAGVELSGDEMRVRTKERWHYRNLKIGSGQQVGEASDDSYEMLYFFKKTGKDWLVDEIRFTSEPKVGRTQLPFPNQRPSAGSAAPAAAGKPAGGNQSKEVHQ